MLEAMFQAGMWLVYATNEFSHSTIVLSESRQVRFQGFVEPGSQLTVVAEWGDVDGDRFTLQAAGHVGETVAVRGRLVLEQFNLANRNLADPAIDAFLIHSRMKQFRRLQDPRNAYNSSFAGVDPTWRNGRVPS